MNFLRGYTHYKILHIDEKIKSKYSLTKAKDSSEWLNLLIAAVFPNIAPLLDNITKSFMNTYLNNLVKALQPIDPTQPKPSFMIDSITVKNVSLGVIAPTIDYLKSITEKPKEEKKKNKVVINKMFDKVRDHIPLVKKKKKNN